MLIQTDDRRSGIRSHKYIIWPAFTILVGAALLLLRYLAVARLMAVEGEIPPHAIEDSVGRTPSGTQKSSGEETKEEPESPNAAPAVDPVQGGNDDAILRDAELIAGRTEPAGEGEQRTRVRLFKTSFKYPLIRVVEILEKAEDNGEPVVVSRRTMVGDHIIVKLRKGVDVSELDRLNQLHDGAVRRKMHTPRVYLVRFEEPTLETVPDAVDAYGRHTNVVEYAEPDGIMQAYATVPNDPSYDEQWGMPKIDAPEAWDRHQGSRGVVVGLIDSGVDLTHPDLSANLWRNPGETPYNSVDDDGNGYVDDYYGWDYAKDDSYPNDGSGHGSHCAGILGAVGNNGAGVAGVNWNLRIMVVRAFDNNNNGTISDVADAINYTTMMRTNGANVRLTSNSYGGTSSSQELQDAIGNAQQQGMLFIAAAGNDGEDNDSTPHYPSNHTNDNIVAVAATTSSDGRWSSSNYGATSVDLGAPGVAIYSTVLDSDYGDKTGTSMATPHVAGAAALLWALHPEASYEAIRDAIFDGTDPISALSGKAVTGGRLNVYGALRQFPWIDHVPLVNTTNTVGAYPVEAEITAEPEVDTNHLYVLWNTTASTNSFQTNMMTHVSNDVYRGFIDAQPLGTNVYYYLSARLENGNSTLDPTNAPAMVHAFEIVLPVELTVTGTPVNAGTVTPEYGLHAFPSGVTVNASAPWYSEPVGGSRYAVTGWVGTGSVPADGTNNAVSFDIKTPSTLDWQWTPEYGLIQTSSVPGILITTAWYGAGMTADTVTAALEVSLGGTNHHFAEWRLSGMRQPDATNVAVNPVTGIAMTTSHLAEAVYLVSTADLDADGISDWWEYFYFGSTNLDAAADADGDTYSNLKEFEDGTDAHDTNSYPRPPDIQHTPLADPQGAPAPFDVTAAVTDNFSVASVTLFWHKVSGPWAHTNMIGTPGITYAAEIPPPGTNGDTFTYYMTAWDEAGYSASTESNSFYVAYPIQGYSPTNFACLLLPEAVTNVWLTITNSGITNLVWELAPEAGPHGWLSIDPTSGTVRAAAFTNVQFTFDATGMATGDRSDTVRLLSNDPFTPASDIPVSLSVRSPPVVAILFAAQTSTNGEGTVTISNSVVDADTESLELQIGYSTNHGATWTNTWIDSADASFGGVVVSNEALFQVTGISTTNGITNFLTSAWNTTNPAAPIVLCTDMWMRARIRDPIYVTAYITNDSPFFVDNQAPGACSNLVLLSHAVNAWSTNANVHVQWSAAGDGEGIGLWRYGGIFATQAFPNLPVVLYVTNTELDHVVSPDSTNWWIGIRAFDKFGNSGLVTNSGPLWIDTQPPSPAGAVIDIEHSAYGPFAFGSAVTSAWSGYTDNLSGISNYYVAFSDEGGTTNGVLSIDTTQVLSGTLNQTNYVYVWARDRAGGIGAATSAWVVLLSTNSDFDQDGAFNADEETAGTDANDAEDVFIFNSITNQLGTNTIVIQWSSTTNRLYSLYRTDALTSQDGGWTPLEDFTNVPGVQGEMSYTDAVEGVSERFYDVRVTPQSP